MSWLLLPAFTLAILEWVGEQKRIRWLIFVTKPLVLITLILWIGFENHLSKRPIAVFTPPLVWFLIALLFCLVGDIFLMLPERFFMAGLIAFLLGHIAYILGFKFGIPPQGSIIPAILMAAIIILVSGTVYRKLSQGLKSSGKNRMILPVFIYAGVISYMLFAALNTLLTNDWNYAAALPVSFGALLFYLSDILNAWHRFVNALPAGRLKIMATYHLAQIGLAAGVVIHFFHRIDT